MHFLAISKPREWKGSAEKKSHELTELLPAGWRPRSKKEQNFMKNSNESQQEVKAFSTEKSKEALELSDKNARLQVEEALTDDTTNSYMVGFEDLVAQAAGISPRMDFSQLDLGNTVVDGNLVDE
ncbi:hypothetical protein ACSQ67_025297 [Phaseolus vulgaris]